MKILRIALLLPLLAATLGATAGESHASVSDLAVIVHPSNGTGSLSGAELESIFTSSRRYWSNGKHIVAFNYQPNDPLRVAFDRAVLRMSPDQVSTFWINQRIRGRQGPPRQIPNPSLTVRVVERLPEAIGYVPADMLGGARVKVVARIHDREVSPP